MFKKVKNLWRSLPEDVRQVIISLSVSLTLLAGALTALSFYLYGLSARESNTSGVASAGAIYQFAPLPDISSLTTYDAIINPAAPGTNGVLAGACLPFSDMTDGIGVSGE